MKTLLIGLAVLAFSATGLFADEPTMPAAGNPGNPPAEQVKPSEAKAGAGDANRDLARKKHKKRKKHHRHH